MAPGYHWTAVVGEHPLCSAWTTGPVTLQQLEMWLLAASTEHDADDDAFSDESDLNICPAFIYVNLTSSLKSEVWRIITIYDRSVHSQVVVGLNNL